MYNSVNKVQFCSVFLSTYVIFCFNSVYSSVILCLFKIFESEKKEFFFLKSFLIWSNGVD